MSHSLVMAEIAVALLLVTSAGLLLRSFVALRQVDPGFEVEDRIAASIVLPPRYRSDPEILRFVDDVGARVGRLPGVQAITWTSRLPLSGTTTLATDFTIEGRGSERYGEAVGLRTVSSNYFEVLRVPLLAGRTFRETDHASSEPVIVINERMASHFFPGEGAVGRRMTWDAASDENARWYRIVGVVGAEHQNGIHTQPQMEAFTALRQLPRVRLHLIVHTRSEVSALAGALRAELAVVDPVLPLVALQPLADIYASLLGRDRFLLALIGAFAALALVLATVGVYGLTAATVAARTREIGIRVALGASSRTVVGTILVRGLALAAAGVVIGLGAAWAGTRLLASVLFGVTPTDAVTFIGVPAFLLLVAAVACAIPARRAARLEPTRALGHD
jgi:predicted permease